METRLFLIFLIENCICFKGVYYREYEFKRDPLVGEIDCQRVIEEDCQYTEKVFQTRITKQPNDNVEMDCESIKKRIIRYSEYPLIKNAIAVARVVDEDYSFLEEQLSFNFHPRYSFCFAVDAKKSQTKLHKNLQKLEKCLPNVYLTEQLFNVSSGGAFMSHSYRECWKILLANKNWKYLLDLQTHDVIVKTAVEISEIVEVLNGSNAIQISPCTRCGHAKEGWYLNGLEFYKNVTAFPENSMLQYASGLVESLISREAIDFLINTISLDAYLKTKFEEESLYSVDEQFLATLQNTENLKLPGGMTSRCLREGHSTQKIVRYSNWDCNGTTCSSGSQRHCVCVIGLEEMPAIASYPFLIANKMWPTFDYSVISCVGEMLYNRTYGFSPSQVRHDIYENLTHTRYHNLIKNGGNSSAFDCSLGISVDLYEKLDTNWFAKAKAKKNLGKKCQNFFNLIDFPKNYPEIYYTRLKKENFSFSFSFSFQLFLDSNVLFFFCLFFVFFFVLFQKSIAFRSIFRYFFCFLKEEKFNREFRFKLLLEEEKEEEKEEEEE